MARKHGKRSGAVRCARDAAAGGSSIIGVRGMARLTDPDFGMYAAGAVVIAYPRGDAKSRADFRRFCGRNGVIPVGIGEPADVGAAGDIFDAYRCLGPVEGLARLVAMPFLVDAHFDCPTRVGPVAAGAGPEKVRPSGTPPRPKRPSVVAPPPDPGQCHAHRVDTRPVADLPTAPADVYLSDGRRL